MEALTIRQGTLRPEGIVGGTFISDCRKGQIIEIETEKHVYLFAIIDATRGEGVLVGPSHNQKHPERYILEGSCEQDSLIVGFINNKMRLSFSGSRRNLLLTAIRNYRVYLDNAESEELIRKADQSERAVA
jgi:hypothetical protein